MQETKLKEFKKLARRKSGFDRSDCLRLLGAIKTRPTQPVVVPSAVLKRLEKTYGGKAVVERVKGKPTRYRLAAA
jgi:transposase